MGLFDFLKPKKGKGYDDWHAQTDIDKFKGIEQADIDSYMSRIDDQIYDFVILTPPEPVDGCNTLMAYRDGSIKIEFSVLGEDDMCRLYEIGGLSKEEAASVVADMANKGIIPKTDGIKSLGTTKDPKKSWLERFAQ